MLKAGGKGEPQTFQMAVGENQNTTTTQSNAPPPNRRAPPLVVDDLGGIGGRGHRGRGLATTSVPDVLKTRYRGARTPPASLRPGVACLAECPPHLRRQESVKYNGFRTDGFSLSLSLSPPSHYYHVLPAVQSVPALSYATCYIGAPRQ